MAQAPRQNSKATKIAYNILGDSKGKKPRAQKVKSNLSSEDKIIDYQNIDRQK
jgi:hypothetical protein